MNYIKIIFDGYYTPSTRKNFNSYFKRQFKKAKSEDYSFDEFLHGCLEVIEFVENKIEEKFYKAKNDLYLSLNDITKSEEALKNIEKEIDTLDRDSFLENLFLTFNNPSLTGKKITWSELYFIKKTIVEARIAVKPDTNDETNSIQPIDINLNQTDFIHLLHLLVDADIIKEPSHPVHMQTKDGFYGKISKLFTVKGNLINSGSAKQVLQNKKVKGTPYSQAYLAMLNDIQRTIKQRLSIKK